MNLQPIPGEYAAVLETKLVFALVDLLFGGFNLLSDGSVPPCEDPDGALGVLDVNGDSRFNVSDIVSTSSYLFSGGAPPVLGTTCVSIAGCETGESCGQP